ncbi:hypothetical protein EJ04DRAFT_511803 [Polyplosphaeria fusca]|uniref:Uncharacterized protein n=1 Tax=Polyplosphaeria fusca TaxID=682080 RepID=A0A9P4V3Q8_9PLEO|nr:hypothetical protein EJ04DRAFT_511803 [Polyplosphaeria fusca]
MLKHIVFSRSTVAQYLTTHRARWVESKGFGLVFASVSMLLLINTPSLLHHASEKPPHYP